MHMLPFFTREIVRILYLHVPLSVFSFARAKNRSLSSTFVSLISYSPHWTVRCCVRVCVCSRMYVDNNVPFFPRINSHHFPAQTLHSTCWRVAPAVVPWPANNQTTETNTPKDKSIQPALKSFGSVVLLPKVNKKRNCKLAPHSPHPSTHTHIQGTLVAVRVCCIIIHTRAGGVSSGFLQIVIENAIRFWLLFRVFFLWKYKLGVLGVMEGIVF